MSYRRLATVFVMAVLATACTSSTETANPTTTNSPPTQQATTTTTPPEPVELVVFGDTADCRKPADQVAELVKGTEANMVIVGDLAYPDGSQARIDECFMPLYGDVTDRIWAVPGDNDYKTPDASPLYDLFDAERVGQPGQGWWTFTEGNWQIIGINSECSAVNCGPKSDQYAFVAEAVAAEPDKCRLAVWHKPRFTSSPNYQGLKNMGDLYSLLYDNGADVLVVGNSHHYERFEPLNPEGVPDPAGIANFTVGTGGAPFTEFGEPLPGSQIRENSHHGVVMFTLGETEYSWEFLSTDGAAIDAGTQPCHNGS